MNTLPWLRKMGKDSGCLAASFNPFNLFRQDPGNNIVSTQLQNETVLLHWVGQNAIASCWLLPVTSGASISYHLNYCPPSNPNQSKATTAKQKHQIFSTTLTSTPWSSEYKATAGLDKLNLYEAVYFLGWIFMKHFSQNFLWKKKELSGTLLNPHPKKKRDYYWLLTVYKWAEY